MLLRSWVNGDVKMENTGTLQWEWLRWKSSLILCCEILDGYNRPKWRSEQAVWISEGKLKLKIKFQNSSAYMIFKAMLPNKIIQKVKLNGNHEKKHWKEDGAVTFVECDLEIKENHDGTLTIDSANWMSLAT